MVAPNPYVGPAAIAEGEALYGRAREARDVRDLLTTGRILLLYGPSGAGKTSLIQGGVLRELREREGLRVLFVPGFRRGAGARNRYLASLCEALEASAGRPAPAAVESLDAYLKGRPRLASEGPVDAEAEVLVLDQFEEIFTLDPRGREATLEFVRELGAALKDRGRLALLCMRESDVAKLDDYLHLFPTGLVNRYRLGLLDYASALEAIVKPAADVQVAYESGAADTLLQRLWDLRGDTEAGQPAASQKGAWLEPVLLQVVCSNLWESSKPTSSISAAEVARVSVEGALGGYYALAAREAATEAKIPERDVRDWVEERLLTAGGTRAEAHRERETGWGLAELAVDALEKRHVVRLEAHAGRQWYELANDILIGPIRAGNARWRSEHLAPLELKARTWARAERPNRLLLSLSEWLRVSRWTRAHWQTLRESEKEFRRASTRNLLLTRGLPVLAAIVVVVVAAFVQHNRELQSRLDQQAVMLRLDRAKELAAERAIEDALRLSVSAAEEVRASARKDEVASLEFSARDALLSVLWRTGDLRRLFIAENEVFQAVAFQPGSDVVAYAGMAGKLYLAGLKTAFARDLDACPQPETAHNQVASLVFDPQGRWLAAGCESGNVAIWSTADWTERGRWRAHEKKVWALAASSDGGLLASGGYENQVKVMRVEPDGTPVLEKSDALEAKPIGYVWSLAFSPVARSLVIGDGVGAVFICEFAQAGLAHRCTKPVPGEPEKPKGENDAIRAIAFSPDGSRIALGHWKGGVDLWDAGLSTRTQEVDVGQTPGPVHSVVFMTLCGHSHLAFGRGTQLHYRRVGASGAPVPDTADACTDLLRRMSSVSDEVYSLAFDQTSGLLAASTRGGYVAVLDPLKQLDRARAVVGIGSGRQLKLRGALVGERDATARVVVPLHQIGPEGGNLAVVTVREGVPEHADRLTTIAVGAGPIARVSASVARHRLATLGPDGSVTVWDLGPDVSRASSVVSLAALDFEGRTPARIALSPDGTLLVCAFEAPPPKHGVQGPPDAKPGRLLAVALDGAPGARTPIDSGLALVREMAFNHDGTLFAVGGDAREPQAGFGEGQVKVWTVSKTALEPRDARQMDLPRLANKVNEIAFAADASGTPLVVVGGEYGQINMWNAETGDPVRTLRAGSRPIWQIAFRREASLLAASDDQGVVRLWSTAQWEPVRLTPRTDPDQQPGFLAFGPKGDWLAVGRDTLTIWDLSLASLRSKACAILRDPGQHGADAPAVLPKVCSGTR
jgi:WD40 repeat protein